MNAGTRVRASSRTKSRASHDSRPRRPRAARPAPGGLRRLGALERRAQARHQPDVGQPPLGDREARAAGPRPRTRGARRGRARARCRPSRAARRAAARASRRRARAAARQERRADALALVARRPRRARSRRRAAGGPAPTCRPAAPTTSPCRTATNMWSSSPRSSIRRRRCGEARARQPHRRLDHARLAADAPERLGVLGRDGPDLELGHRGSMPDRRPYWPRAPCHRRPLRRPPAPGAPRGRDPPDGRPRARGAVLDPGRARRAARACSTCSPAPARWGSRRSRAAPRKRPSSTPRPPPSAPSGPTSRRSGRRPRSCAPTRCAGSAPHPAAARQYDLVFLDPPYRRAGAVAGELSAALPPVLAPEALVVAESDRRAPLELDLPDHRRTPLRRHPHPHPCRLNPPARTSPSAPAATTRSPSATWTSSHAPRRSSTS